MYIEGVKRGHKVAYVYKCVIMCCVARHIMFPSGIFGALYTRAVIIILYSVEGGESTRHNCIIITIKTSQS